MIALGLGGGGGGGVTTGAEDNEGKEIDAAEGWYGTITRTGALDIVQGLGVFGKSLGNA